MKKTGFTLMELILSIVLVGIVLVSMIGALFKIKESYDIVNVEVEAKTYKALVAKVINEHLMDNGGVKTITCNDTSCNILLGNNKSMTLEITNKIESEEDIKENNNKVGVMKTEVTTIKYYGNGYNYLKSTKMTSLEYNSGKKIESGYKFVKINSSTQTYQSKKGSNLVDKITTITIEMSNPKYNIEMYSTSTVDADLGVLYTLTYDNRGGHGCVREVRNDGNNWGPLCLPQRDNYGFLGWFNQPDGGSEIFDNDKAVGNKTIYAQWSNKRYSCPAGKYLPKNSKACVDCKENHYCEGITNVLFDKVNDQGIVACLTGYNSLANSVSSSSCKINCSANTHISIVNDSTCTACDTGYISNSHTVSQGSTSNCNGKTITVTFDCVNGSSTTTNQFIYGSLYALNASGNQVNKKFNHTCSRTGYTGDYWIAPNGTNKWDFNNSVSDDWINNVYDNVYGNTGHNITLTPQWSANKFTVAYNANGGSGTTNGEDCTYDSNCSLANNGFSRSGYKFTGWKKENSGSLLVPGTSIKNVVSSGTVTYYAQWEACGAGTYLSGNTCTSCPQGSYSSGTANASCTSCPSGYTTSATGTTAKSSCYITCAANQRVASADAQCTSCGSGYTSSGGTVYAGNTSSCTQTQTCGCDVMYQYNCPGYSCVNGYDENPWSWCVDYANPLKERCYKRGGVKNSVPCTKKVSYDCGKTYN